jgi:hypothetical protein
VAELWRRSIDSRRQRERARFRPTRSAQRSGWSGGVPRPNCRTRRSIVSCARSSATAGSPTNNTRDPNTRGNAVAQTAPSSSCPNPVMHLYRRLAPWIGLAAAAATWSEQVVDACADSHVPTRTACLVGPGVLRSVRSARRSLPAVKRRWIYPGVLEMAAGTKEPSLDLRAPKSSQTATSQNE